MQIRRYNLWGAMRSICAAAAGGLMLCSTAQATVASVSAHITLLDAADNQYYAGSNLGSLQLTGVTSLAGCAKNPFTGLVFLRFKDNQQGQQMYATALAAALAGVALGVSVNDTNTDGTYCYINDVSVAGS